MKIRTIKIFVAVLFLLFGLSFFGLNHANSSKMTTEEYNNWITKSYDFRFGKDKPFSPSNATTFSGKFIKRSEERRVGKECA